MIYKFMHETARTIHTLANFLVCYCLRLPRTVAHPMRSLRKPCVWFICFAFVLLLSLIEGPYSWGLGKIAVTPRLQSHYRRRATLFVTSIRHENKGAGLQAHVALPGEGGGVLDTKPASTLTTGTDGGLSPPAQISAPPSEPGRHVAEFLNRAAVARSMLIGEVHYDFMAGPSARKRTAETADAGTSTAPVTPLRIAQFSQVYMPAWTGSFAGCDRPCEAVGGNGNVSAAASADVVVINMMRPDAPWTRPPGQIWVGTYFESPDHYPTLRDAATLARFNYTSGYRPDADFPIFNMVRDTGGSLHVTLAWPLPGHALKCRHPMMSTWISNCHLDSLSRLRLLTELVRHNVTVSSYGRCGPGHASPLMGPDLDPRWRDWAAAGGPGAEKAAVSAQHLFMYAAENSGCAYYITEKVIHAFLGGSVPVYLGDSASLNFKDALLRYRWTGVVM